MCENFNVSLEIEKNSMNNIIINGYTKMDLLNAKQVGKNFLGKYKRLRILRDCLRTKTNY